MSSELLLLEGDILLTRSRRRDRLTIISPAYQKFKRRHILSKKFQQTSFTPTHVAMVFGTDHIIQSIKLSDGRSRERSSLLDMLRLVRAIVADGFSATMLRSDPKLINAARNLVGRGIVVDGLEEFLTATNELDLLLLRPPVLEPNCIGEVRSRIQADALYHLDKPYNLLVEMAAGGDVSAFCSEFIYEVYRRAGAELPPALSHRVLPIDYLIWAIDQGWTIYEGREVKSAFLRHLAYRREHPSDGIDSYVELHRSSVAALMAQQQLAQTLRSIRKLHIDHIEKTGGGHYRPSMRIKVGGMPTPHETQTFLDSLDQLLHLAHGIEMPKNGTNKDVPDFRSLSWSLKETTDLRLEAQLGVPQIKIQDGF